MEKERTQMEIRLIELRKAKGLSQSQLADTIHVCRQSVSDWERGASRPTRENLVLLSELYGVSVDYLLEREPRTPPEEVTQPQTEEAPPTQAQAEPSPEGKPEKNLKRRLWCYRIITLVLAILLVVMGFLLTQEQKVEYHKGETVFADELPADKIDIPIEEFE